MKYEYKGNTGVYPLVGSHICISPTHDYSIHHSTFFINLGVLENAITFVDVDFPLMASFNLFSNSTQFS